MNIRAIAGTRTGKFGIAALTIGVVAAIGYGVNKTIGEPLRAGSKAFKEAFNAEWERKQAESALAEAEAAESEARADAETAALAEAEAVKAAKKAEAEAKAAAKKTEGKEETAKV